MKASTLKDFITKKISLVPDNVVTLAFGIAMVGSGAYLSSFVGHTNLPMEIKNQEQMVSNLEKDVRQHWESLRISNPYDGLNEIQAAELYLLRPDAFGQAKADSGLAYKAGSLLLERSELAQLRKRKREYDVEENKFLSGAFFAFIMGGLGIFVGLTTAKGATDEQARYKKGQTA